MSLLQSVLYGLMSGLSELMPVSSSAHQLFLRELFGAPKDPVMDMLIHITVLVALYFGARNLMDTFQREQRLLARRSSGGSARGHLFRFVRTAGLAISVLLVIFTYAGSKTYSFLSVSLFCLINGILLFIPGRMVQCNKDARHMTAFDSLLFALFGALSVFPGFSRMGMSTSYAVARGADRQHALNWALLVSVPALVIMTIMDFIAIFTAAPAITFITVVGYLLAIAASFIGSYYSITIMKFLAVKVGYSAFAYYSWGMALFSFVLYLI